MGREGSGAAGSQLIAGPSPKASFSQGTPVIDVRLYVDALSASGTAEGQGLGGAG